jgi:alpha-L-rhamnosidase
MRFSTLWLLVASAISAAQPVSIAALRRSFVHPPADARIMVRWWWFGPAVTRDELEREMVAMKAGGIGGFEVQPVYPLALDNPARGIRNLPYLSPQLLSALRFTAETARKLGLRFDLTLGSGWPFGGPEIPITEAAGRLRVQSVFIPPGASPVAIPDLHAGEAFIAGFLDGRPLTRIGDDRLALPPGRDGTVTFFIASRTRMKVKRAAAGAEGFVLDHYDRAAIDTYLKSVGDPLMNALGPFKPHAVFSDSLEVNGSDWTGNFLAEFRKRRGYDLLAYLPMLVSGAGAEAASVRHDWGETLTELADENYLTPVRAWAHRHGTLFRSQTYGAPPVDLSSNALVDLPEGEGWNWRGFSPTRWASSASHLYGRPVTSSETWTWLHSPVFRATPLDLKAEADLHFLEGINQLVGHGWPYSPPAAGDPGWHFYAAAVLNRHNPWWLAMPDIARYLQRVSFMLRQGKPVNDVALYLPTDDAWASFTPGHVSVREAMDRLLGPDLVASLEKAGYDFDFIDDAAIRHAGIPYRILLLPDVHRIPLDTYRAIRTYARNGGAVIATGHPPSLSPGLIRAETDTPLVRDISRALFAASGARGRLVESDAELMAALHSALTPDVSAPPEIGFVHRKLPFADIYFVVNTSNHPVIGAARFRVAGCSAEWWNPVTGAVTGASKDNRLDLRLAPYESRIAVFSSERAPTAPADAPTTLLDLSNDWELTFADRPTRIPMPRLRSWTDLPGRRYFSGRATYSRKFAIARSAIRAHRLIAISFGPGTPLSAAKHRAGSGMRAMLESPVREAAVVYVNGKRAGSVWAPPYEIEVGKLLRPGVNRLRIVVANLAINRLAGEPRPNYSALRAKYGDRFQPQDMDSVHPCPAGILGGVRLTAR